MVEERVDDRKCVLVCASVLVCVCAIPRLAHWELTDATGDDRRLSNCRQHGIGNWSHVTGYVPVLGTD